MAPALGEDPREQELKTIEKQFTTTENMTYRVVQSVREIVRLCINILLTRRLRRHVDVCLLLQRLHTAAPAAVFMNLFWDRHPLTWAQSWGVVKFGFKIIFRNYYRGAFGMIFTPVSQSHKHFITVFTN